MGYREFMLVAINQLNEKVDRIICLLEKSKNAENCGNNGTDTQEDVPSSS